MANRRAIYAARFLRPPGFTKRLIMREKPRVLTGPFENPVRRWVRLREKARQFDELPPPRKVPVPKHTSPKMLQSVQGVPKVSPEALERRLEFLLSPAAEEQQLSAELRPGLTPFFAEWHCWERQLRDLRRVYRAQYLQRLAEVTEVERQKEETLKQQELMERRRRKQAHLQRIGDDMKRRAILKDRKRIEAKVTEAMEMARRSKLKRQRLYWFRHMENLSKLIVSAENFDQVFGSTNAEVGSVSNSGVLMSRNVSVPFLLRQLGGAKGFPKQKAHRIPFVENVQREILESSYDILPEDAERFAPEPSRSVSARTRAKQLYAGFTEEEKFALLEQKMGMLEAKIKLDEDKGQQDPMTVRLLDELGFTRLAAHSEGPTKTELKQAAQEARGRDPSGLPPRPTKVEKD
mmetsp:Transcript_50719/g.135206  ORF Transcript_50719/g.135206 Transcript_50719/m.135206 type:complete len:406 (-) Transcript_50719:373-1590(-)|eukprot:CAMPEP_0194479066 /NCGR_PEP_ID=MMETSP0253-20130528/2308_1 /TAXON_ID=2966 /ORGANISM="Noctiluca scintillans" /LENGTH=405 /DNA_ID=CAMNT_0039318237 /DNA_START=89 /DNA_END=1306 /DNA_ORIENTATION=-